MKPNIFLTTPPFGKVIEPLYDKPNFVRYSLASLASIILKENVSNNLFCCDAKFSRYKTEELINKIYKFNPQILGISAFTYEIEEAAFLAKKIKFILPKTIICIGGTHVTALPIQTMEEFPHFDIGFVGESELSFLDFCKNYDDPNYYHNIKGICFRKNQQIILNPPVQKIENLDELPIPAWHLFPPAKEYFIQTSRGCPFNCNFCFNPNGNKVRQRSAAKVIEEIEWLIENRSPKRISLGDEAFGTDNNNSLRIIELIAEKKLYKKVSWDIQTHVSYINEIFLKKVKNAGISKIELGVESGNEEILKNIGKGINKQKIINAFELCKKYEVKTGAFLIFGHPGETIETINETINFACKLNPTEPVFAIMVPFPGTKIFNYYINEESNYIYTNAKWNTYRKQINNVLTLKNITNRKLKLLLIKANIKIYLTNHRYFGLLKFLLSHFSSAVSMMINLFTSYKSKLN